MPGNVRIRLGLPMKKPLQGAVMIAIATAFYSTPAFCIEEIEEWQKYIKQEQAGGPQFAEKKAVTETMRLSDIMGVREAFLLFPITQQCQGRCGMG